VYRPALITELRDRPLGGVHAWLGARGRGTGSENTAANSGPLLIPRAVEQMDRCGRTRDLSPQVPADVFEVKFLARCRSISNAPISGLPLDRHLREHRLVPIDIIVNDDIASGLRSVEVCRPRWRSYRVRFGGSSLPQLVTLSRAMRRPYKIVPNGENRKSNVGGSRLPVALAGKHSYGDRGFESASLQRRVW
jgi:hypothetical protein